MDESVVKHLEQIDVGTLKPSEALREGAKKVNENHGLYLSWNYCGCAVAMIAVGLGYTYERKIGNGGSDDIFVFLGEQYPNLPPRLFHEIDERHASKCEPAASIANWLERQGL